MWMSEHSIALTMPIHVAVCLFSLELRCMVDYPLHQCLDAQPAPVCVCGGVCVSVCVCV